MQDKDFWCALLKDELDLTESDKMGHIKDGTTRKSEACDVSHVPECWGTVKLTLDNYPSTVIICTLLYKTKQFFKKKKQLKDFGKSFNIQKY